MNVPESLLFYFRLLKAEKSASSARRYKYDLLAFYNWLVSQKGECSDKELLSLPRSIYEEYLAYRAKNGASSDSVRRLTFVLNGWLTYLSKEPLSPPTERQRGLTDDDFVTEEEMKQLIATMKSPDNRTKDEIEVWRRIRDRNLAIVMLLYKHGLSLKEVVNLSMRDINLTQGILRIQNEKGVTRTIKLTKEQRMQLVATYNAIPKRMRPYLYSEDPIFVAFSYGHMEYKLDYITSFGTPWRLSGEAIKKMIKLEVRRAGLRPISATQMRNTRILEHLKAGKSDEEVLKYFGLSNWRALIRYKKYLKESQNMLF
ncbi:tyrosine-type recombinase/integrase [Thermaerobacillus caldiproteolyticus]|uniref:tyrosine-type recombinase/integrase n=1 Tax=Thermaerobacillus caldiproteolyticus TaxID=247480 RepID=UPI00188A14BA|nr:tyrosine-type recombinase/integrase [Anoxybacillus caldiproteolyticus]QPA33393.1 tyrosine-type recombinase/integrase [Anoxybacillus caldiproteolyticus]